MRRYALRNDQGDRIKDLLPGREGYVGATAKDNRRFVEAVLYRYRAGIPWRDLPERYGPWPSVYTRFRRWTRAGVWDQIFAAVQRRADAAGELDWSIHFVDGTVIRAHQHAAGAKGGTRRQKRLAGAGAASARRCTSERRAAASR